MKLMGVLGESHTEGPAAHVESRQINEDEVRFPVRRDPGG